MAFRSIAGKIAPVIQKYKYAGIVLIIGVVLMLIPVKKTESPPVNTNTVPQTQIDTLSAQLEQIISQIQGAGEAKVLLTEAVGERITYQEDSSDTTAESGGTLTVSTVILTGRDTGETGLVVQVDAPKYLGAIVLCKGADNPSVKLAVTDAVSKVTGLKTNQITVLKMK